MINDINEVERTQKNEVKNEIKTRQKEQARSVGSADGLMGIGDGGI
jgi:hypothetical protein